MEQWSLIHNQPLLKTDFTRTGRGGEKEFKLFVDFNLCGPSLNAIKRCQSGYTRVRVERSSLICCRSSPCVSIQKQIYVQLLKKVHVIPVSLASDGTALKPGLDPRQKQVIGLTHKVDEKFVKKHPLFVVDKNCNN